MQLELNLNNILNGIVGIVLTVGGFFAKRLLGQLEDALKKIDAISEKFSGHEVRIVLLEEKVRRLENEDD